MNADDVLASVKRLTEGAIPLISMDPESKRNEVIKRLQELISSFQEEATNYFTREFGIYPHKNEYYYLEKLENFAFDTITLTNYLQIITDPKYLQQPQGAK